MQIVTAHQYPDYFASAYAIFCSHRRQPWQFETFLKSLLMPCSVMAIKDQKLLGYALVSSVVDEVEIEDICVNEQYRKQGVGDAILAHIIKTAKKNEAMHVLLEVAQHNQAAITLYQKHGFITVHVRKQYYQLDDNQFADAILMRKQISSAK